MRTISEIIIHCSATPEGRDHTVQDIDRWHRARGWEGIGYHYVVYRDGTIHRGRPEEQVGAHCQNHNQHSIGICYIGGLDQWGHPKDTRTPQQKASLSALIQQLKTKYPHAIILSHHTLDRHKACPCFSAECEYRLL